MPKGVMATVPQFAAGIAAPQHRALWVLALSGLLGLWIGITGFPNWQVAVETAQVVAGLVTYPSDNPFYIYHVKLWTVLHQVLALLLRLGVSEIALSEMLSGLLGMVSKRRRLLTYLQREDPERFSDITKRLKLKL